MKLFELVGVRDNGEMRCFCPWHDDSTPSFDINLQKNVAHCFHPGCFSGTAEEAIKLLLGRVPKDPLTAFEYTARKAKKGGLFLSNIPAKGIEYLYERGFTQQTLERWEITFDEARLCVSIPAKKRNGFVLGMIYRQTSVDAFPKYLYSKGFRVSKHLFGVHMFEPFPAPNMYVVEGPLDCVWMWQCGFTNTVSLLGSNLSDTQARLLRRLSDVAILALDNDSAGKLATRKVGSTLFKCGYDVYYVPLLKTKKDVQEHSPSELAKVLENKLPILTMLLKGEKENGDY